MGKAKVEKLVCGSVWTNCYFLINTQTKETIIIDPADNAPALKAASGCQRIEACGVPADPRPL